MIVQGRRRRGRRNGRDWTAALADQPQRFMSRIVAIISSTVRKAVAAVL